jgi:beta-xylosidase
MDCGGEQEKIPAMEIHRWRQPGAGAGVNALTPRIKIKNQNVIRLLLFVAAAACLGCRPRQPAEISLSGNPVLQGWYADPEAAVFGNTYWIYPTYSAPYENQVFFDAFSSPDLITWTKHPRILDTAAVRWAKRALWAPAILYKDNRYFLFFGANDIQHDGEYGGIGIAVSDRPEGPFTDYLGRPLVSRFYNGAQPIDQFVFNDNGAYYLIYGGWGRCNIGVLQADLKSVTPQPDGALFREITPDGYVEGPVMFKRHNRYYFMWSEGGWTGPDYRVAYAVADTPYGPFKREAVVLRQDTAVATGAGHHSVLNRPGTDEWFIVYHRRPLGLTDRNARVVCIDKMAFDPEGKIEPVKISFEGAPAAPVAAR